MKKNNIIDLFSNVGGFNKAFKASENHEIQKPMKDYKLADEVIAVIAEKGTIKEDDLESFFEDKAVNCLKFRADFKGLMKWLSAELGLILYAGDNNGLVTLAEKGRRFCDKNYTVKEFIEHEDKLRADEEATIKQNLENAKLNGFYTIVKIVGTIVGSILIPLAGFVANDIIRTTAIALGSAIIGALWRTDIGKIIRPILKHFMKD